MLRRLQHVVRHTVHATPVNRPTARHLRISSSVMSVPTKQHAVIIEKSGGTDVLQYRQDWEVPKLADGQILVKNDFIGVNFIDTYFRTGLYPVPSFPYILGREGAGTVAATASSGELYGLKEGDRVVYMAEAAYQEYTAAPAAKVVKIPDDVKSEDATAALLQGLTAWTLLKNAYPAKAGEWILVHAAAGGVGQWLVQLAKHIGAKVIALVSTQKINSVKSSGADVVVDYTQEDYVARVKEITNGEGVAAVYDSVGKDTFEKSLESVARCGTFVSYGNASGAVPPFAISRLSAKNIKILRPTLFNYVYTREQFESNSHEVFEFLRTGIVKQRIHDIYSLKDAARAQDDLAGRKTTGKLLLRP